ncbi:pectin lyase B [Leptodontidium sp. MPI-SDFR-AT-0119]|nr:pectin lyase B [Leptodontidium sp. MPI-SDFR-AT-0119]
MLASSIFLVLLAPGLAVAQVKGSAYGFAKGVSGGGSATAAAPKDIAELKSWLADATARVILIDKTFDFRGTEGTSTDAGCYQSTCTPANGGQTYIGTLSCGGSNMVATTITWDKAGATALVVGSNKSIVGVGTKGVIIGKGLRLLATTTNVIIQNIHITNINPKSVWGGDALAFEGSRGVWVDHCKLSLIGRMFIVSHFAGSQLTVSNTEFDGATTTSATCNGDHYWGAMFFGTDDFVTLDRNYWHDLSGRSPKLGADGVSTVVQATNNFFYNNKGHDFDISAGTKALIEGNVFESVITPMTISTAVLNVYNVPDAASATACASYLGRNCVVNALSGSGEWPSKTDDTALASMKSYINYAVAPIAASGVKSYVTANAGIGRI